MANLGSFLRSATVLTQQNAAILACKTGISRDRINRIFAGRAVPTPSEVEVVLHECGLDPSLVTTPTRAWREGVVAGAAHRSFTFDNDQLLGSLLLAGLRHEDVVPRVHRLRIDKLSFSFNVINDDELLKLLRTGWTDLRRKKNIDKNEPPRTHYLHSFTLNGIFVQHGLTSESNRKKGHRSSRIEFSSSSSLTPKALRKVERALRPIFQLVVLDSLRVTRIDIAVDLPISIRDVQGLGSAQQKAHSWVGPDGVETITFGSRGADRQIEIYDRKKKLILLKKAVPSDGERTRFEARLRNLVGGLDAIGALKNPFANLTVLLLEPTGSLRDRLLVSYARFFGVAALRECVEHGELSKKDYHALLDRCRSSAATRGVPHPASVYAKEWERRSSAVLGRLRDLGLGVRS